MNTLIKQETVNFHTLVTTNCVNTNLNFQSKLIDELNRSKNNDEQNLFFYLFIDDVFFCVCIRKK
jgi:hypothetical protein